MPEPGSHVFLGPKRNGRRDAGRSICALGQQRLGAVVVGLVAAFLRHADVSGLLVR